MKQAAFTSGRLWASHRVSELTCHGSRGSDSCSLAEKTAWKPLSADRWAGALSENGENQAP